MAYGPITSWQIDGETATDFVFGAPKSLQTVIAAKKLKDAYSLERKLDQLSILKSRDITFPKKVHPVKAMIFPVVMYGCESCHVWMMLLNCGVGEDS